MKERFNFKYTRDEFGREVHKFRWSILFLILLFQYIFTDSQIRILYKQSVHLYNDGYFFLDLVPIVLFILTIVFVVLLNYIFNWFEVKSGNNFFKKLGFFSKLILDTFLLSYFYFIFSYFFLMIILSIIDYYILGTCLKFPPVATFIVLFLAPLGISTFILVKKMQKTCWLWGAIFGIVLYGLIVSVPNLKIHQGIEFDINYLNIIFYILLSCGFSALWQFVFTKQEHVTGYDFETTPGGVKE